MIAVSVDGFELLFPAKWWKAELNEIKDIHIISIGDKPGIKLADQIVNEMDARGQVIVPDNCVTGEAFEEWREPGRINKIENNVKVLEETLSKVTTDKMILEEENKFFKEFAATVPEAWAQFQYTLREHTEQAKEEVEE